MLYGSGRVQVTLNLLNIGPKVQEEWCWQFRYGEAKSYSVHTLSEKVKAWFNKERKKLYTEVANIYSKNESSIHEIVKKGKEIHPGFVVTP